MLDETQAYVRAEQHLRDAVSALDAEVQLVPKVRNAVPIDTDPPDAPPRVDVWVSYSCLLSKPTDDVFARNRRLFEQLGSWWRNQGYDVVLEDLSEPFTRLRAVDPDDQFTVTMKQGRQGNLWCTVNSPPVSPTGVKPPPSLE